MPSTRVTDPDTSHEAAASVKHDTVKRLQTAIVWALGLGAMTDEMLLGFVAKQRAREGGVHVTTSPSSLRTRRSELVDMGVVEAVPDRYGITISGRRCKVWRLKPEQRLF